MKVTNKMINKDVRFAGVLIRTIFKFRRKRQFVICNKLLKRFMKGKYPRGMNVKERFISTPSGDKMRILICCPSDKKPNAVGVLWIHGGGYALGIPEQDLSYASQE